MLTFPHFEPHFARAHWTLPHVLEHQARHRAQRPFLSWTDAGPALSYAEVNSTVNRLAHGMAAFGIGRREHVGILLPNCLEFLFAWFALNKLGAVEVAISDAYKGSFLAHPLQLSQARTLITTATLAQRLVDIEDQIPIQNIVLVNEPGADPALAPPFSATSACTTLPICTRTTPPTRQTSRPPRTRQPCC
jgi:crotonobetaine/carnitine-CoA ligase